MDQTWAISQSFHFLRSSETELVFARGHVNPGALGNRRTEAVKSCTLLIGQTARNRRMAVCPQGKKPWGSDGGPWVACGSRGDEPHWRSRTRPSNKTRELSQDQYNQKRWNTMQALVPPKPKLLLIIVLTPALSRVSSNTGRFAAAGSSSAMLAEAIMKLFSSISRQ